MEAHEIAEQIHEHSEYDSDAPEHHMFRRIAAIYIGVVAMLLAIATLGGAAATKEMLSENIHASDTYAFYQSKYQRQISYQIAAEQLELLAAGMPGLSSEQLAKVEKLVQRYRDIAVRYESEPSKGDGKKELLAKADEFGARRDHAAAQSPNFEYAEALFQIAIVLGSVAIVAGSGALLGVSSVLAIGGMLLTANGYWLIVPLSLG
ncbi:MAG TPA: DUF4337 domain-containing protein [Stellaceae bacterium]|nr:DUF4337 domain-containing protein [Stellaceae bacterium]